MSGKSKDAVVEIEIISAEDAEDAEFGWRLRLRNALRHYCLDGW